MSGICETCKRTRPCPNEYEGLRFCAFRERGETRWERLFGTPERAARTLAATVLCIKSETFCCDCEYKGFCDTECSYDALAEWLRGDA